MARDLLGRPACDVLPVQSHMPRAGRQVACEQIGQRRFASTIGANDGMNFTFSQINRYIVNRCQATKFFGDFVCSQQQIVH